MIARPRRDRTESGRRHGWSRWLVLVATAAVLSLVTGCGQADDRPIFSSDTATAMPTTDPELLKERQAAGIADCLPTPDPVEPVAGGLPELALGCLGGGPGSTLSALRGQPMVINFWAQWCGPCREEAPVLAAVSSDLAGTVQFIGVDTQDPQPRLAIGFAKQAGWTYPQLVDQDFASKGAGLATGLPTTLLVTADGKIAHRLVGPATSEDELRALIHTHLGVG